MGPADSSLLPQTIGFIAALTTVSISSFLETSITAVKFFELRELSKKLPRYRKLLERLENRPHEVLVPILIFGSLADVTASALMTRLMQDFFAGLNLSEGLGFSVGIALASFLTMLAGQIIPKNFARLQGQQFFGSSLWLTNAVVWVLYPFTKLISGISDMFITLFSASGEHGVEGFTSEQELRFLIDYVSEKNLIEPEKSSMLKNIFQIGSKNVRDILVPENRMITLPSSANLQDALQVFGGHRFSRIPVYDGDKENIIGILYLKDLFLQLQKGNPLQSIKDFVRPVLFVPESMKVSQVLKEFRAQYLHMAIVLSEHGEVAGLVTLEDVLEEIVGEIRDENELIVDRIMSLPDGGWLVDARINIDELGSILHVEFETEDAVTLGGFMIEQLQHLPKKGERVVYQGFCFQVQQATVKQVQQVLVFRERAE